MYPAPGTGQRPPVRQSRAVVLLAVTLAALVALWVGGGYLLYTNPPEFGELPGGSSSPSPTH